MEDRRHHDFGKRLRQARKDLGWNQYDLSKKAGCAENTVKAAELGRTVSPKTFKSLTGAINKGRADETPSLPPLSWQFSENNEVALPSPRPAGHQPPPLPSGNPWRAALHEALRVARDDEPQVLRIGRIETPAQLRDLWEIDASAYGPASITFEHFHALWSAFPHGLCVLFIETTIVGAIGIWPVSEAWATELKAARLREQDLNGAMMRRFRSVPARYWYISGIVLLESLIGSPAIKALLAKGVGTWLREAKLAYPCELLALASSDEGRALLMRWTFIEVQKATAMPDGYSLFGLKAGSRAELLALLKKRKLDLAST